MFKALWPPAAVGLAAALLFAAALNYVYRDNGETIQPAAAPAKISPMLHKLPYRLDDGRKAPAEATMTGQLHATSYVSPAATRPAALSAAEQQQVARYIAPSPDQAARIGNFGAPQVRWVYYYPPPQQPRVVYYSAAPHKHRGPIRRFFCRR